jgi:hypothetical protein
MRRYLRNDPRAWAGSRRLAVVGFFSGAVELWPSPGVFDATGADNPPSASLPRQLYSDPRLPPSRGSFLACCRIACCPPRAWQRRARGSTHGAKRRQTSAVAGARRRGGRRGGRRGVPSPSSALSSARRCARPSACASQRHSRKDEYDPPRAPIAIGRASQEPLRRAGHRALGRHMAADAPVWGQEGTGNFGVGLSICLSHCWRPVLVVWRRLRWGTPSQVMTSK